MHTVLTVLAAAIRTAARAHHEKHNPNVPWAGTTRVRACLDDICIVVPTALVPEAMNIVQQTAAQHQLKLNMTKTYMATSGAPHPVMTE